MLSATDHLQESTFAVTWASLTASLELDELGPQTLELVPAPTAPPPPPGTNGRWEMVVPQMVRTQNKTFEPVAESARTVPPSPDPRLLPPPLFSSFQTQSLFSRAVSMFGKRTRLLESPAPPDPPPPPRPTLSPAEIEARRAARELLLSKIARSVRGKGDE